MSSRIIDTGDNDPIRVTGDNGIVNDFLDIHRVKAEDTQGNSATGVSATSAEEAEFYARRALNRKREDD